MESVTQRGLRALQLGKLQDALAAFDEALGENPAAVGVLYLRAVTLSRMQRSSEALAACRRCLVLSSGYEPALELLGRLGAADPALAATQMPASPAATSPGTAATVVHSGQVAGPTRPLGGKNDGPAKARGTAVSSLPLVSPDDYVVEGEFARGGMGRILKAHHRNLDRPVALKELFSSTGSGAARFLREAFITARLQHPAIVPIYEAGRWPDGSPFYAMKLVKGRSLEAMIDEARTLEARLTLLPNFITLSDAVAYAHGEHIIHRDLKPANVLCGDFGETVVIDWGIAKDLADPEGDPQAVEPAASAAVVDPRAAAATVDLAKGPPGDVAVDVSQNMMLMGSVAAPTARGSRTAAAGETQVGAIMGTLAFMPPEQARGIPVDARADVYALGAVLYSMLSGEVPYKGHSFLDVLAQLRLGPPTPLEALEPRVPPELLAIVNKAMARDANDRYPTAKELAQEVRRFQAGQLVGAHTYSWLDLAGRWLRRHRSHLTAAVAVLALAAIGISEGLAWDRRREKVAYFGSLVWQGELAVGLGPVSASFPSRRALTYRFTSRGGRVLRVEPLNGSGQRTPDSKATYEFRYRDNRQLLETVFLDRAGRIIQRRTASADLRSFRLLDEADRPRPATGTEISLETRERDPGGYPSKILFHDTYGSPRFDERKAFGYELKTDGRGLITEWRALGPDGLAAPTAGGLARMSRTYDSRGNPVAEAYFGIDGQPMVLAARRSSHEPATGERQRWPAGGFASFRATYDEAGNRVSQQFFDAGGLPVRNNDHLASWKATYDRRGNRVAVDHFGVKGAPTVSRSGCAGRRASFDDRGYVTEERCLGVDGQLVHGVAIRRYRYDASGRVAYRGHFDRNDRPTVNRSAGYASIETVWDGRGNVLEQTYLDPDGKKRRSGYARWRARYDGRDRQLEKTYFDATGKPTLTGEGFATIKTTFNQKGQATGRAFFGIEGQPVLRKLKPVARPRLSLDRPVEAAAGTASPAASLPGTGRRLGYASVRFEYDGQGNEVARHFLGVDGNPVLGEAGAATWRSSYDERGNQVEVSYFGKHGEPLVVPQGFAARRRQFDGAGRVLVVRFYDAHGQPTVSRDGFASVTLRYDERGRILESAYLGTDGMPTLGERGFAALRRGYSRAGQLVELTYLDTEGRPIVAPIGYASSRAKYDDRNHQVELRYFGPDGKPMLSAKEDVAGWRARYDEAGNEVERTSFGLNDEPRASSAGYASRRMKHDAAAAVVETTYHAPDGTPVEAPAAAREAEKLGD